MAVAIAPPTANPPQAPTPSIAEPTTGEAAAKHGRSFVMVDESAAAIKIMEKRLKQYAPRREDASPTQGLEA